MTNKWRILIVTMGLATNCFSTPQQTPGVQPKFDELYRDAQAAMAAGKYDEARSDYGRLEKLDPGVAEVHASLAALCFQAADFNQAIEEIHAARKLKPSLRGMDTLLSLSLAESGKYKESLPGLEKAFRTETEQQLKRQAGLELARVYSNLSMDRKSVEVALELRDQYKDDPEVLYNVGKILGNSAYLTMQQLFHGAGGSVWTSLAEAEAQESQGQFADAIASYRTVLEMDPHRVNIHYRMGRTYLAKWESSHSGEDLQNAESEFEREINADPGNANAAYELAGLRHRSGDDAAARRLYEAAIKAFPDFQEAEVGLGGVLLDQNEASLAVSHLQRATVIRPDDEVAWYRLAQAERALGDAQAQKQALATFQKLHGTSAAARDRFAGQPRDEVTPQELGVEAKPE